LTAKRLGVNPMPMVRYTDKELLASS
jgi:hypothetical protein